MTQSWSTWRCPGYKRDGRTCGRILAEVDLEPGSRVRIKCRYCNTTSTQELRSVPELVAVTSVSAWASYGTGGS